MSDSEPYEEEFDSESESVPHPPSKPHIPHPPHDSDHYSDEGFEDKSSEVLPLPPKLPSKHPVTRTLPSKPTPKSTTVRRPDDDFFLSNRTETMRKASIGADLRTNAQSTGQLPTAAYMDSPGKARKYLSALKRENEGLRGRLKEINAKLDGLLDMKISEKPKRGNIGDKATSTQLETATKQLSMLKKEQSALSVRLEQVEDPAYLESLQRDVAKHQLRLSKLSTLQKRTQKTKKTCENTIEKELLRNELSMNTRHLQELHMENEGVRMQIREAELDEDRNYALSVEMQDQQDRLEERYTKLMARARENGAFEESSREAKKSKRVKKEYEEKKSALSAVTFTADASGKSLKRQEAELKAELDGLTSTYKAIIDQIRDKQRKLLEMAKDLKLLAPKLAGTGYESLLERIAASIADKEALVELPISAISVKYDRKPSQKSKNETSNRSLESESAPKPPQMIAKSTGFQKESPMPRPKPGDLSPKATNPPIKPVGISSKPSLFSSNVGSEGEVMEEVGGSFGGLGHGESSEPDIGKKPSFVASKPSLFGKSAKTEEKQTSFLLKTQNIPQTESTSSPSEPSFLPLSTNPEAPGPAFPPASDPTRSDLPSKPTLLPPPKPDPLKAIPVIPEQAEEIKTLDAFPSRRRGKHLGNEAISSLITSPSALSSLPPVVDSAIKPRNRDHLLVEDPQPTSMATVSPETVLEVPYKPTNLSIVGKPARDRSHLVDLASKPDEFPAISPVDSPREQKRLISGLETSVKPMDFALGGGNSDKHRGNEAKEKTKDLAKKAEKGGFFELDEESLDFTDLKPAGNVHQGLVASNQAEKPVKRTEIPKPDIVDLEESDILL